MKGIIYRAKKTEGTQRQMSEEGDMEQKWGEKRTVGRNTDDIEEKKANRKPKIRLENAPLVRSQ